MAVKLAVKDDTARLVNATAAARAWLTANAPGWVAGEISDDELKSLSVAVLTADDSYQSAPTI